MKEKGEEKKIMIEERSGKKGRNWRDKRGEGRRREERGGEERRGEEKRGAHGWRRKETEEGGRDEVRERREGGREEMRIKESQLINSF